jgi:modulator of drug activity B
MNRVLIINTHHPYPSSGGALNAALTDLARAHLESKGYELRVTKVVDGYNAREEADKHVWADVVIVQGPVNWMSFPGSRLKPLSVTT